MGIAPVIQGLINQGLFRPGQSACNTLNLPIKKPRVEYLMVEDLRVVNETTENTHPVVLNPYTLLVTLRSTRT